MNRAHQVRAALQVLKPPAQHRTACRGDIEGALDIMAKVSISHEFFAAQRTKAHSKAMRSYHKALCRLLTAQKALLRVGGAVSLDLDPDCIEREIHWSEPRKRKLVASSVPDDSILQDGESVRAKPIKPTYAVALAYELVHKWGGKIARTRPRKREIGGDVISLKAPETAWWELAAIIYGEEIDLYQYLREFKPKDSPFQRPLFARPFFGPAPAKY